MTPDPAETAALATETAFEAMRAAMEKLQAEGHRQPTRHNSLAITYLEIAMMFNNKDRTNKGFLKPYPTHITSGKPITEEELKKLEGNHE